MMTTTISRAPRVVATLLLAMLGSLGCSGDDPDATKVAPRNGTNQQTGVAPDGDTSSLPAALSGDQARAEFEAMCRTIRESDHPQWGRKLLRELQQQQAMPLDDPEETVRQRWTLGRELLEQGQASEAVTVLEEALALVMQHQIKPEWGIEIMSQLATANLRAATEANDIPHHNPRSCILPISEEAIHSDPRPARRSGDIYLQLLNMLEWAPRTMHVAWLHNLSRMYSGDYPGGVPGPFRLPVDVFEQGAPFAEWHDRGPELGVAVLDLAGGALMDDFDGDGLLDLISSTLDPCGSLRAFRNDGRGGFEDTTVAWGLDSQWGGLNLIHADYDNDGRLDLFVMRGAWLHRDGEMRNSLLRNELGGPRDRFVDVSRSAGVGLTAYPTQAGAFGDYDGDGDLDLFVGNEATQDEPYPSELYRNDGDGAFTDVATAAGVENRRYAKGVAWGDYDNDGDRDLYVSNIGVNRLYRNNGDGTFTDVAPELGVTQPEGRSFATWFFDYNNDGNLDIFVVNYGIRVSLVSASYFGMEVPEGQAHLYRNDGGTFTEVSRQSGLTRPTLPMGANFGELDNDGFLDVYLTTGNPNYETILPNVMYRNAAGRRFEDVTFAGGFGQLHKGHGVAFGDLDNDGDQDLFHQVGGMYPGDAFFNALFENPGSENAWITLQLEGRRANHFALGARIEIRVREAAAGGDGTQNRSVHVEVGHGGSFGGSSLQQEIGLGRAQAIEEIVIRWPGSGTVQRFANVEMRRTYRVVEGTDGLTPVTTRRITLGGSRN
jgi:hypothetical protein